MPDSNSAVICLAINGQNVVSLMCLSASLPCASNGVNWKRPSVVIALLSAPSILRL